MLADTDEGFGVLQDQRVALDDLGEDILYLLEILGVRVGENLVHATRILARIVDDGA